MSIVSEFLSRLENFKNFREGASIDSKDGPRLELEADGIRVTFKHNGVIWTHVYPFNVANQICEGLNQLFKENK